MHFQRYIPGIVGVLLLGTFSLSTRVSGAEDSPPVRVISGGQEAPGENVSEGIAVWQGFEHHWTYNHRLNRLGDYVRTTDEPSSGFRVFDTHTAATGIGDDEGTYQSYYAFLSVMGIHAVQKQVSFHFRNRRGRVTRQTEQVSIPWDEAPYEPRMIAFVNGYDLVANQSAFKLQTLQISVSKPRYDAGSEQITCQVSATLNMQCRSLECKKFEPNYNYTLRVEVLVLMSGPVMHSVEEHYQNIYDWDRKAEPPIYPVRDTLTGAGNGVYPNAILGFRSLSILLNREHWFIDIASDIYPGRYDPNTGSYDFDLNLLFKAWKKGMRRHAADRLDSQFSFREKGSAVLLATVIMVQLPEGCVIEREVPGRIIWRGKSRDPRSPAAVQTIATSFNTDCTEIK